MACRKARVISSYLAGKNRLRGRSGRLDVPGEQVDVEAVARLFRPIGPIQSGPVSAHGVPAEWIRPPDCETRGTAFSRFRDNDTVPGERRT
jgi:hypothetical protein